MNLRDRRVLVTGAARRVGRAIALALAERGARLAIHFNRSRDEAQGLATEIARRFGGTPVLVRAALERVPSVERMVREAARRLGGLEIVINNASAYDKTEFGRTTVSDWDRQLDTNLRAPFFVAQAAAPFLKRAGQGKIVNIADWAALRPYADYIPYCVSKAGLVCLNAALAKALAPEVQVNAILPGPVMLPDRYSARARERARKATLLKKLGSPEDIAKAVVFLVESGDFITGASLTVDGGRLIA